MVKTPDERGSKAAAGKSGASDAVRRKDTLAHLKESAI